MTDQTKPLISIIAINYNQLTVTCEFIDSTKKLQYPNYEIILVDNASHEDPTELINSRYPHVKFIRNHKNLGFSGANNVGIRASRGDFYFIVNNDTEVTPNLLDKLIEPFFADDSVGVVSPKIRYFSHPNLIQYAGYSKINPYTGRNKPFGMGEEDNGQFDRGGYTAYAHGAAMLVKKEVVQKVGLMPEIFFIYYEELDWSSSIKKASYNIYYQPSALIFHKESVTMGKESLSKVYFQNRNRVLFMKRNASGFQFLCFTLFLAFIIAPTKVIRYSLKRNFKHAAVCLKAFVWTYTLKKVHSNSNPKKKLNGYFKFISDRWSWLYRISRS